MAIRIELVQAVPEREQAADLRRSVLCGELHLSREVVEDGLDLGPACRLLLAWDGAKPVATARLRLGAGGALLEHLAVLPARRRQGLGRALVDSLARQAREDGREAVLCVAPQPADPFFVSCGFVQLRQEDGLTLWQKLL